MISYKCPDCGSLISAWESSAGEVEICPECDGVSTVPAATTESTVILDMPEVSGPGIVSLLVKCTVGVAIALCLFFFVPARMISSDMNSSALQRQRTQDISRIKEALDQYRTHMGEYPIRLRRLEDTIIEGAVVHGPWIDGIGMDPTDQSPYEYMRLDADTFILEGEQYGL